MIAALLALAAGLAVTSLLGDSITYDETSHLTAGMSYLKTGDYRLAPDHPPLAKIWVAWPLLFVQHTWPPPDTNGWQIADVFLTGRTWLFELNDGERMLPIARCMMVVLLLALCVSIFAIGRMLFGPAAGLLALVLAALSPTVLAHGRLVTTDVPITLCLTLTLLAFARLLRRVTATRLLAVIVALGAASVTKMSWPLVLPAMLVMAVVAILWAGPIEVPAGRAKGPQPARRPLTRHRDRAAALGIIAVLLAVTTLVSIWTCYGWRISMFAQPTPEEVAAGTADESVAWQIENLGTAWHRALHDEAGNPRPGPLPGLLRRAAEWHLLPDAYLFGLAWTLRSTSGRDAYFRGETSAGGWRWYFPVAFAIKTPIATLALLLAGIVAMIRRREGGVLPLQPVLGPAATSTADTGIGRHICGTGYQPVDSADSGIGRYCGTGLRPVNPADSGVGRYLWGRCGDPVLLAGLAAYVVIHVAYVVNSSFNIGHRHLLPIYPAVFVLAGASAFWLQTRGGRWLVPAAVAWLAVANLWIYPHYLSYFNEFIGGPANGHHYLADSNIDWGQDLKRLAREHPDETVKLSYFGSAVPTTYGFACQLLPSSIDTGSPEHLDGGGLYVVSVTHLLGVYDEPARDSFWERPAVQQYYRDLDDSLHAPPTGTSDEARRQRARAAGQYAQLRWGRFLFNLRRRPPDERIGYSLFVYRLTQTDIDELTRP